MRVIMTTTMMMMMMMVATWKTKTRMKTRDQKMVGDASIRGRKR